MARMDTPEPGDERTPQRTSGQQPLAGTWSRWQEPPEPTYLRSGSTLLTVAAALVFLAAVVTLGIILLVGSFD